MGKITGKKVKWYGADSYAAQVEALRSGRLHVAGISTGADGVRRQPGGLRSRGHHGLRGRKFGYRLQLITHKDSDIMKVSDMKGRKIAHVTPSSNSGNQAPRALFKSLGVEPDVGLQGQLFGQARQLDHGRRQQGL